MAHQPAVDERRLVGPVVVKNHLHVERRWRGCLDCVEELAELPDDLAGRDVQRAAKSEVVPWRV